MKNYIQPGNAIDIVVPAGGVVSGRPFVAGSLVGISAVTAAEGGDATIHTDGVYELPKVNAQAWVLGAKVYWDAANSVCTTVAAGSTLLGFAARPAANPSAIGLVKLGAMTV